MMSKTRLVAWTLLASAALVGTAAAQDTLVLQGFEAADLSGKYATLDTKVQVVDANGSRAMSVTSGTNSPYPNVRFSPPGEAWDLSPYKSVDLDITNTSQDSVKFAMRVDNEGATGQKNHNIGSITLDPGETGTLSVVLVRPVAGGIDEKLIGMDRSPWGRRGEMGGSIDVSKIVQINLFLNKPDRSYSFTIDNLRATGAYDPNEDKVPQPFFPFIDSYGQYMHKDWPGKVKSDGDLAQARAAEQKSIQAFPRPADWDQYGGWRDGPQLNGTGHFTTTKQDGKWYLVDPDGRLFFSLGMDCVKAGGSTAIDQRDGWFADQLWDKPQYAKFVSKLGRQPRRGDFKGSTPRTFDFFSANLQRKYGANYDEQWSELITKRLQNWGFNTLGNWADPDLFPKTNIPYTHWIFYEGPKLPWRQGITKRVPDPFNPRFEEIVRQRGQAMTKGTTDDPKCIGYFVDNEIQWGAATSLAETTMLGDGESSAKCELIKDLKAKYGTIAKLNAAWSAKYESWEAMLATTATVKELPAGPGVKEDYLAFGEKMARTYFSTVKRVLKEIAPNKLYLGCRFAEYNPMVVRVAAEYCDVVSFNIYRDTIANWKPPVAMDKPVVISEFHFGAKDRGVFGDGLVRAASTADRAHKYERYVTGAAQNPNLVGTHWFQLNDEPTTGRPNDGENHNIGFLSITDTPYAEMVEASREVAGKVYSLRAGKGK